MNNEDKAEEIARNDALYGDSDNNSMIDECYIAALEMAQWKDEQFDEEKKELLGLVNMLPIDETNQTIIEDLKALLQLTQYY